MTALEPLVRLAEAAALGAPIQRKRMLVVVNPYATTMTDRTRNLVVAALHGRYEVEAIDTQARGHATEICREAAKDGYDVIVSFGGDGTVNEVANGLAGCPTPVSCLPGGATNVLCKMLGIPGDIVDATEHLLSMADTWNPRRIDLGTANGRAFTYTSGFGVDASVVKRIEQSPKLKRHRLREYFFVYAAVETVLRHYVRHPPRMEVHIEGRATERVITTIVQNGEQMTFLDDKPIYIAQGGGLDSGSLAGVALRGVTPLDIPGIARRLLSSNRSVVGHRQVLDFRDVDGLRCVSADGRPIALHADGDHLGDVTEAVFGVLPGALAVVS
jgi:diacylglycerol kinase family enzyme